MPETKHRGFAFVTYSSSADAQDAIDNMDLNELNGRVLRVNLAKPMKGPTQAAGNRASTSSPAQGSSDDAHVRSFSLSLGVRGLAPQIRQAVVAEWWYASSIHCRGRS